MTILNNIFILKNNRISFYSKDSDFTMFKHSFFTSCLIAKRFISTKSSNKPVFGSLYLKNDKARAKPLTDIIITVGDFANKLYFVKHRTTQIFERGCTYSILVKVAFNNIGLGFTIFKMLDKQLQFTYKDIKSLYSLHDVIVSRLADADTLYIFG